MKDEITIHMDLAESSLSTSSVNAKCEVPVWLEVILIRSDDYASTYLEQHKKIKEIFEKTIEDLYTSSTDRDVLVYFMRLLPL